MKSELPPTMAGAALKKDTPSEEEYSLLSSFFSRKTPYSYKFWVLSAILLLAFWSIFIGSLSLKWSYDGPRPPIFHDLDILEVEERERAVRHMWNLYAHGNGGRLPKFWSEAFEAAYEDLIGDVPAVRDAALLEIARMSLQSVHLDPIPIKSKSGSRSKISKQTHLPE